MAGSGSWVLYGCVSVAWRYKLHIEMISMNSLDVAPAKRNL